MYINLYEGVAPNSWKKANFHAHAGTGKGTCGRHEIKDVVEIYEECGYDFLCISNHDTYTETNCFTSEKMTMIQGVEYSNNPHMLTLGVNHSLLEFDYQTAIDKTLEMGGFVVMCHPNWQHQGYWSVEELEKLRGYIGVEVFNSVIYRMKGSGLATDVWDEILSKGKLIYAFGSDDFHRFQDASRAFTLINCERKDYASLHQAIVEGKCCASTGVYPELVELKNNILTIKAKLDIPTYVDKFLYKFIDEKKEVVFETVGEIASFELTNQKYVRVEVVAENGAMMFLNPIFEEGFFK